MERKFKILKKVSFEDKMDYLLGEARMLDSENKITGDLRKLAKECGINYDKL